MSKNRIEIKSAGELAKASVAVDSISIAMDGSAGGFIVTLNGKAMNASSVSLYADKNYPHTYLEVTVRENASEVEAGSMVETRVYYLKAGEPAQAAASARAFVENMEVDAKAVAALIGINDIR